MLPKTVEVAATKLLLDGNRHKLTVLGSGSFAKAYIHEDYPEYVIKISRGDSNESSRDYFAGYYFGRYCMRNPSDILPATYLAKRYGDTWVLVQKRYLPVVGDTFYRMLDDVYAGEGLCFYKFHDMFPKANAKAFEAVVGEWYCVNEDGTVFGKYLQDRFGGHAELVKAGSYVNRHVRRESYCSEKIMPDIGANNIMLDGDTRNIVYVDPFCLSCLL